MSLWLDCFSMQRQTEDGSTQKSPPSGLTAQTAPGDASSTANISWPSVIKEYPNTSAEQSCNLKAAMSGLSISHSHIHRLPFIKKPFVFASHSAEGPSVLHLLSVAFWMSELDYPTTNSFVKKKSFISVFKIFLLHSSLIIKQSNWSPIRIPHLSISILFFFWFPVLTFSLRMSLAHRQELRWSSQAKEGSSGWRSDWENPESA